MSKKLLFLKNYVTSEGAIPHNVLYYQQLSIARYQVVCVASNYFEYLPKVSSAFKVLTVIGVFFLQITSSGAPFWSGPKRCPHMLKFDESNVSITQSLSLRRPLLILAHLTYRKGNSGNRKLLLLKIDLVRLWAILVTLCF